MVNVDRLRALAPVFLEPFAGRPVELHSHCTIGHAPRMYMEGARLGFATLHTVSAPVANGTSQPSTEVTTVRRQLEEIRRGDLFDAALDEVARVRAEFGYPIVVTPYAQLLVTQASMNVMAPERTRRCPTR